MIQTKKRSTTGFDTGVFILSINRNTKKNTQSTKNHIATIFNPFMQGSNKGAYIRSKFLENMVFWNWVFILRRNPKRKEVLLTRALH